MDIYITIRQLGKKRNTIESVPFSLPERPQTLRGLIASVARVCASGYNARLLAGESGVQPMTEGQLQDMEAIGKLAFGLVHGEKPVDPEKAAEDAVLAFEDGLFRVFQGQAELTSLDAPLDLNESDEFTFIRLVMLAGSIW